MQVITCVNEFIKRQKSRIKTEAVTSVGLNYKKSFGLPWFTPLPRYRYWWRL